jgi:uncharacterized protein
MHSTLLPQLPAITALCEAHGVLHLELFGSAASDHFNPDTSDVDFLVELDSEVPGSRAKRWIALAEALEQLLGRHVDLVNPKFIRNSYFMDAVNASRVPLYDRQDTQTAR